ncbi:MAG: SpoIIE family protein phosphatase [Clostridiaceae bacterium]
MKYYIDTFYKSLNKYGEELCGDKVEIIKSEDRVIIVLADGLGSGVKANILSTMTSKIAATMLREGATIEETVETIVATLPVCKIRKIAYSTFTIIEIDKNGICYVVEYDNPPFYLFRDGRYLIVDKKETIMNGKKILESKFALRDSDKIVIVSDGVVHAGVGGLLNLGFRWENIKEFMERQVKNEDMSKMLTGKLIEKCSELYQNKPGDDTTVVTLSIKKPKVVTLFTGPPKNPKNDSLVATKLMCSKGKKIVCGGTAGKILERFLGSEITVLMDTMTRDIPPMGYIRNIDLVTEGVITLSKTVDKINKYNMASTNNEAMEILDENNGASKLASMLIQECTNLNLIIGKAINPAHQNPDLPIDLSIKLKIVDKLVEELKAMDKEVKIEYIDD